MNLSKSQALEKYYYNNQIVVKKSWGRKEFRNSYVEVKVLGSQTSNENTVNGYGSPINIERTYFLIELPNKKRKVIRDYELFTSFKNL